ncbi:MAG: sulfite exporter TauE/SafE family protein [Bdellovibrionales bacterium]|nr:sulfite exporter TauE/SafE family protein [Bdellovibrionales bacterium]
MDSALTSATEMLLLFAGFAAGCIDSIAGGGGLITLPVLSSVLEPGAHAIGTNKIVGAMGALIAFVVYLRKHPLNLKRGFSFVASVGVGSLIGSLLSPMVSKIYFRYFLIAACPMVLWVVWNKQLFLQEVKDHASRPLAVLIIAGILVGFYDGFFGPGGGTFMLIGLLWGAKLPLFEALLLSKLANTLSASVSLVSYGVQGYVHMKQGLVMAIGMTAGGFLGASLATKRSEKVVRPVLVVVVLLLVLVQLKEVLD